MNRLFRIRRRRPNIVDVFAPLAPLADGIATYRVKVASNFDGTFNPIINSPKWGYIDSSINRGRVDTQPTNGVDCRIVFDPANYSGVPTSLVDTDAFWMTLARVDGADSEVEESAPTLVLPDMMHYGVITVPIAGTAPSGAPLQFDLPLLAEDMRFTNLDAANNLLVSTLENGPQHVILASSEGQFPKDSSTGTLYVQGDGGDVAFTAVFTLAFPR